MKQSPACIVARDLEYLKRELSKWKKVKDLAESQIPYLEGVIKKTEKALSFIRQAAKETILQLKVPQNWQALVLDFGTGLAAVPVSYGIAASFYLKLSKSRL